MGAWTATERLTLIDMLTEELQTGKEATLFDHRWYADSVRHLSGATNEFLELHRRQFLSVIARYNAEKPEEKPAI